MYRILSVSYDQSLLTSRELVFRACGYDVVSALGMADALNQCSSGTRFDLFILGHSIPYADKQAIVAAFRQHCSAPVIALHKQGEQVLADVELEIDPDPPVLLASVAGLIRRPALSA